MPSYALFVLGEPNGLSFSSAPKDCYPQTELHPATQCPVSYTVASRNDSPYEGNNASKVDILPRVGSRLCQVRAVFNDTNMIVAAGSRSRSEYRLLQDLMAQPLLFTRRVA